MELHLFSRTLPCRVKSQIIATTMHLETLPRSDSFAKSLIPYKITEQVDSFTKEISLQKTYSLVGKVVCNFFFLFLFYPPPPVFAFILFWKDPLSRTGVLFTVTWTIFLQWDSPEYKKWEVNTTSLSVRKFLFECRRFVNFLNFPSLPPLFQGQPCSKAALTAVIRKQRQMSCCTRC